MQNSNKDNTVLSSKYDTVIALMNVYLSEWKHRDLLLWQQVFRYYYANLTVILAPNIINFSLETIQPISTKLFRVVGILMTIFFLYISLGYAKRLEAIGNTYQTLINMLPKEYRREPLKEIPYGKLFHVKMGALICFLLSGSLIILALILIFIT